MKKRIACIIMTLFMISTLFIASCGSDDTDGLKFDPVDTSVADDEDTAIRLTDHLALNDHMTAEYCVLRENLLPADRDNIYDVKKSPYNSSMLFADLCIFLKNETDDDYAVADGSVEFEGETYPLKFIREDYLSTGFTEDPVRAGEAARYHLYSELPGKAKDAESIRMRCTLSGEEYVFAVDVSASGSRLYPEKTELEIGASYEIGGGLVLTLLKRGTDAPEELRDKYIDRSADDTVICIGNGTDEEAAFGFLFYRTGDEKSVLDAFIETKGVDAGSDGYIAQVYPISISAGSERIIHISGYDTDQTVYLNIAGQFFKFVPQS
ncbi:MAG: hypothetical protein IKN38_06500 [Clostridia bacterium]|nr:hypothetical protein [Clostridia bacterium]